MLLIIKKTLYNKIFKKPILLNIHTNRLSWHVGAGIDKKDKFDRLKNEIDSIGKQAKLIDFNIKKNVDKLWKKHLEQQ